MHKKDLKKMYPLLELLSRLCDKDLEIVLEFLDGQGCAAIYECILNGLHNKSISKEERKKIQKAIQHQEKEFKYLKKTKSDTIKKQKELVKVGASTGLILQALIPLLTRHIKD